MTAFYALHKTNGFSPKVKVIGVGCGGGHTINYMIRQNMLGVEFIVVDTDAEAIDKSQAKTRLQLSGEQTRGLGSEGNPKVAKELAELEKDHLRELLVDTDMLFITAGMGGGTGTGAAPVIAKVAKEMGILSVGIVTQPFGFEGSCRRKKAEKGVDDLCKLVDTLIVIPNTKLHRFIDALRWIPNYAHVDERKTDSLVFFPKVDAILYQAVQGISDLICNSEYINVDFSGIKSGMSEQPPIAMMSIGRASGDNRVCEAIESAIFSFLLEYENIREAYTILMNVRGNETVDLNEVYEAAGTIANIVDEDTNIIIGMVTDPNMGDELSITVVAMGLNHKLSPLNNMEKWKMDSQPETIITRSKKYAMFARKTIPQAKNYAMFSKKIIPYGVDKPYSMPPHCSWGGYKAERRLEEAIKKESLAGWSIT